MTANRLGLTVLYNNYVIMYAKYPFHFATEYFIDVK